MEFSVFFAGPDDDGRRLDRIIRKKAESAGISSVYSAIRKGLIKVNEKKTCADEKIKAGDKISIASFLLHAEQKKARNDEQNGTQLPCSSESQFKNSSESRNDSLTSLPYKIPQIKFETVFQNEFIKIINKPYDVNVHGKNSLASLIEQSYKNERHAASLSFTPGPLHRLDKKTTGLLVFSNSLSGAVWFSKEISDKTVRKFYVGICQGTLQTRQIWNDCIIPDFNRKSNFYTMKIDSSCTDRKHLASTVCTPLAEGIYKNKKITLCQFEILTGKKHQIRCQSAFHGIALLGDTAYGAEKIFEKQDFFLHAYKMIFPKDNPCGIPQEISASLPENYQEFLTLSLLNWDGRIIMN
ncbi:MAG: pseudouridine synthase [Treponema sp.]